jgi:hypothetical protein
MFAEREEEIKKGENVSGRKANAKGQSFFDLL